jgi:RNA polymerase sigma-70 factor (ECF subfamily)
VDPEWVKLFLDTVPEPERFREDLDRLAARLEALLEAARVELPGLPLSADFVAYLAARVPPELPMSEALAIHAGDLLLARSVGAGDAAAMAIVEARYLSAAPAYLAKYTQNPERLADVLQSVREQLFVGPEPKIGSYRGRGPLGGWLRSTLVNAAINIGDHEDRMRPFDVAAVFQDELFTEDNPDLALFRDRFGPAFRLAFQDALATLNAEERNLLRWSVVEGKSIDRIAEMAGIHRATAARRIAACRHKLFEATRGALAGRVPGSETELASMMKALKSVVETSLHRFLRA